MVQPLRQALEGKYEILYRISVGGMGAIYKVTDRRTSEPRVVKVLRSEHAQERQLRARFRNEARMAMRLDHPNIARVHDFSVDREGTAYIVMEFIDGVTVEELISKCGPPSIGLAAEIGCQTLEALAYLHGAGIVHRDIASDNVMLAHDDRHSVRVKLIDLGIAKGEHSGLTATGMFMGKVRYACPELFTPEGGAARLDERSDLYSFGVLLYELLTGVGPIAGDTFSEIVSGHLFHPPLDFAESDEDGRVPEELRAVTLKALEKRPQDRFRSAAEMVDALSPFRQRSVSGGGEITQAIAITATVGPDVGRVPRVSTTQERLDREFGIGVPDEPRPAPAADGPIPAAAGPKDAVADEPAPAPDAENVGIRLRNAHLLLRLDRLEESRRELLLLLESDPQHRQARELLGSIEAALERSSADGAASDTAEGPPTTGPSRRRRLLWAALPLAVAAGLGAWYLVDRAAFRPADQPPITDETRGDGAAELPGATRGDGPNPGGTSGATPGSTAATATGDSSERASSAGEEASAAPETSAGSDRLPAATAAAGDSSLRGDLSPASSATTTTEAPRPPTGRETAAGASASDAGAAERNRSEGPAGETGASASPEVSAEATGESSEPPLARDFPHPGAGDSDARESPERETAAAGESGVRSSAELDTEAHGEPVPDVPPRIVRRPLPRYPRLAKEMGVRATVVVEVRVDRDGRVVASRLASGDDSGLGFNEAALKAARSARFEPARLRGEPLAAWTTIEFEFRLDDPD